MKGLRNKRGPYVINILKPNNYAAIYVILAIKKIETGMKKVFTLMVLTMLMANCGAPKTAGTNSKPVAKKPDVQYKDDFRAATEQDKHDLLNRLKATGAGYSVLIFTKNFKGEKIKVSNTKKTLYNDNLISNLKSGIAGTIRIDNTADTTVFDNLTKKDVVIEAAEAQKHKFIYLMKNPGADNVFTITYSNTLRPLE